MRFLASMAMRGRSQAVMAATVLAILALPLPPLSILSAAVVALVTLRRGIREGLLILGLSGCCLRRAGAAAVQSCTAGDRVTFC